MEDFKVCVESLHTTKVKEINYEGEETYQEKPSLSKRLSELAQRVDFTDEEDYGKEEEVKGPPAKKPTRRWPWEFCHSKLKQALTEVSVLTDVLHILQDHRQYITLDSVYNPNGPSVPIAFQYNVKKKAVGIAASILRKGAEPLLKSSSKGDHEFHKAIHDLRKRWRLRRTMMGVLGDLSYHSAGSLYTQSVQFEVHKGTEESDDILSVIVPQELRGQSEIVVFLSDSPVREVGSLESILPSCIKELHKKHSQLSPWEQKLVSAQNVLFNEELFAQLAKEAFDQKSDLQGEVLTDRINIPLNRTTWLSVLLMREYEGMHEKKELPVVNDLPEPNWELSVAFKQLLRTNHQYVAAARPPRPSNASSNESPQLRSAGSSAMSTTDLKQFEHDFSLYNKLVKMAKHLDNEKKVRHWLKELCSVSVEPHLKCISTPSLSLTSSFFHIAIISRGSSLKWIIELTLSENSVSMKQEDGTVSTLPVDKERITGSLKRQCVLYMTELIEESAIHKKWLVLFRSALPQPSLTMLKSGGLTSQACSIMIEKPNGMKRIEILIGYGYITLNISDISHTMTLPDTIESLTTNEHPENTKITLNSFETSLIQQLSNILDTQ